MVFKFLGKGKKSEYFLEAPSSTNGAEPPAKAPEAKVADAASATAPLKAVAEALAPAKELVANGAAEVAEAAKAQTKKIKKSKSAETKPATSSGASPVVATPAAKPAPQSEPVKNFATDHLMPAGTPRRRPGPSLDIFRTMAKDVTPRK